MFVTGGGCGVIHPKLFHGWDGGRGGAVKRVEEGSSDPDRAHQQ